MNPSRWSGEAWRWLIGTIAFIIASSITWTWAVAGSKGEIERSVEGVTVRVVSLEKSDVEQSVKLDAITARASSTEIAIAGIVPQLMAINQSLTEIKADVRETRAARAKEAK
jgi:hypothetical protein